ncbi:MAG: hypothetical protein M9909_07605, partial [Thermomicrobiales bacterium]|nr:hypothetical protein [Thermomicrobiales bacterium]
VPRWLLLDRLVLPTQPYSSSFFLALLLGMLPFCFALGVGCWLCLGCFLASLLLELFTFLSY